jgi:uncharacterized delta-60 repeat protein
LQPVFPPYTLHPTPFSPETLATYQGILGDADLDTTFGIGGKVTKDFSGSADSVEAITIDSNGKILVAGYAVNAYTDIALARYNSDGVLDPTFGTGGIVTTAIQFYDKAHAITIDSNGKILVAGQGRSSDFALVRYNSYGVLDNTFGTGGIVTTDITSYSYGDKFHDITIDSNGKILAAGYVDDGSNSNFALVRYNSNGSLDTSFGGGDGKVTTDFGSGDDFGRAMTIDSSGKILVGGYARNGSNDDFGLARYNSNGSLDTSFGGGDGKVTTNFGSGNDQGFAMTIDSSGKILVAGYAWNGSNRDFSLARYNSNGSLDTSFGGGDGKVITDFGSGDDEGRAITIDGNGKILVSGFASNGSNDDFALARYNSDGTLDTTFDTDGKITKAIGSGNDEGYDITIDSSGKILVAGRTQNGINSYGHPNDDFGLVRYGTPDFTSTAPTSATEDVAYTYDIAANLKLAITGTTIPSWLTLSDNGNGTATLTGTPTNSEVGNHSVSLKITDPDGGTDTQNFTIAVSNVNDAPTDISLSSSSIAENSANNTTVGILSTTDPDTGNTHTYTLSNNAGGRFKLSGNQIQVANSSLLNYESATSHTIQVRTTDQGGLTYTKNFTIGVTNVNEAPQVNNQSFSIEEHATNGATVGTVVANDVDGNSLTYSITAGNDDGIFSINSSTGKITIADSSQLDFETTANYNLTVQVKDAVLGDSAIVAVNIINVNDAPEITSTVPTSATEDISYTYDIVADDPDVGDSLTISALTALPSWLTLTDNGDGTATLAGTPTNDEVGGHTIELEVADADGAVDTQNFTLTVSNVNDAPEITSTALTSATEDVAYTYNIVVDDPDVGDSLTITGTTLPSWLTLTDNGDGTATLTGTPTNDEVGDHTIELEVADVDGAVDTQNFTLTVSNVNDAPEITSTAPTSATEDISYTYDIVADDPDAGDSLTISALTALPSWLTLTDNGNGTATLTGTPTNDEVGGHTIELEVADADGAVDTQNFTVTVTNVNDAPEITSTVPTSATEDVAYTYNIVVDDPDVGDSLTITGTTLPSWLTLTDNGDGTATLTGTPTNDEVGGHTIELEVADADGAVDTQNFTVTVTNVNDAPEITSTVPTSATEDITYTYDIVADDPDVGDSLTISALTALPSWLTLTDNGNGTATLTGTPTNDEVGDHTIELEVADVDGAVDTQNFTLTVSNVNDAPEITSTAPTSTTQGSTYTYDIVVDDPDVGDSLTISALTALPDWLILTDNSDGTATLAGTPTNDEVGDHAVELQVEDADGEVATQSFTLKVKNTNDTPTITGTPDTTVDEDTNYSFIPTSEDIDGDVLSLSIQNKPDWATFDSATGELSGTPTNDDVGTTSNIVISVSDGTETVALDAFDLTVNNVNDAPTITGTPLNTVNEDTSYSFTPTVEDVDDGDTLTFSIQNKPDWATFDSATGELSGTPTNDDVGTTSNIVISVSDGTETVALDAFDLTVNNVNDAPTIMGTPLKTVNEDTPYSFIPTAKDVDDGDTLTFSIQNKPAWASFNPATGKLSGTPTNDDVGTTSNIVISVSDGKAIIALDAFDLTVNNVNDAPTITGTPLKTVNEDTPYSFIPTAKDVDDGDTLTFSIQNKPAWVTFDSATGKLSGTPTNDDVGTTSNIVISVSDGTETVALDAFDLTVNNVNDAPTITGTPLKTVNEDTSYSFIPTAKDVDDGDTLTFSIQNKPAWASFNPATGKLSGTPTNDDVGTTSNIVISVSDGKAIIALDAFDLTVNNVNDAPTITGTPLKTVNEDTPYSFIPTAKDVDDGDTLTFSIQNKPAWVTFDSATGKLSGTPTNAHVGTTSNIVISVSDGTETVALPGFNLTVRNVNDAPTDISPNQLSVVENSLPGTVVGTLSTTDSDVGDSHTYILQSNPDGSFKVSDGIFKISGRNLVVGQGYKLDYEAYGDKEPKQVIVRVLTKDKGGLSYYEDIAIDIEDAVITSDSELDRYLRDRNIISVPSAALKTVFNVFEIGERFPDTTPTAQVEYGQNGLDASNDIISLTRVQDASIPLPKFLSALGTISPDVNLSPVDSLLKSFGASIDVSEPTFTITDLNSGPIYEVSGKVPLPENQKNFLGFLKDVLGVDELTLKAGFNSVTLKPYVLAPIDISDITLFEAGDFSLELTSADLFMEVDPKSQEATVAITPKANLANYDPTQSNEPDLELQGLFTFEKDSMMAGLMLAPSQVWKNPLGIQNTEIRKVSLELGKSYVNPSFDKINLVGDLKSGTIDIASAFAIDATDPKKTAILLTSNNPIGWSDIVSLPVFSYGLAKQGIASKIQPVKDTLQFLANMMDIEIQSIDADNNGILDPLIKLVPESVTIAGTTVQPGFAMNGKFTAWGATAILAVEGNPYNYTNPNFTGSLQIPKIDWGWLKLSGANNSALNFEIAADSRQQSFSGNGSVSILGKTIANTDFTLVSSSNSQSVEIDKFNVNWGILGINANDVLVSFTSPIKDPTGVVKTKQIPKEIAGTGSITVLGKTIANTDFEITQTSATIKDFDIDLGILALDADNVSVNLGNQTIAGTGSVTVLGKTIANTDFEITQTSATIKDFDIDWGILALDADNVSINPNNQSASFKAGVEILGQRFSNVDVTLNKDQLKVKNLILVLVSF